MRTQELVRQGFVFTEQPQEQVLGLDVMGSELRGFVATKEDHATRFFGVSLKHGCFATLALGIKR
jgi:hypothetical protein